ncbi:MAG: hypothetical protein IB617_00135 [Candidatus Nealsonbacteria bacterium]|nr:MAG: hypothetical protein IB617_00135 [Candidatus Nealsonbacteria bacterium]
MIIVCAVIPGYGVAIGVVEPDTIVIIICAVIIDYLSICHIAQLNSRSTRVINCTVFN